MAWTGRTFMWDLSPPVGTRVPSAYLSNYWNWGCDVIKPDFLHMIRGVLSMGHSRLEAFYLSRVAALLIEGVHWNIKRFCFTLTLYIKYIGILCIKRPLHQIHRYSVDNIIIIKKNISFLYENKVHLEMRKCYCNVRLLIWHSFSISLFRTLDSYLITNSNTHYSLCRLKIHIWHHYFYRPTQAWLFAYISITIFR